MTDPQRLEPPYPCPMPPQFRDMAWEDLPEALRRRALAYAAARDAENASGS